MCLWNLSCFLGQVFRLFSICHFLFFSAFSNHEISFENWHQKPRREKRKKWWIWCRISKKNFIFQKKEGEKKLGWKFMRWRNGVEVRGFHDKTTFPSPYYWHKSTMHIYHANLPHKFTTQTYQCHTITPRQPDSSASNNSITHELGSEWLSEGVNKWAQRSTRALRAVWC